MANPLPPPPDARQIAEQIQRYWLGDGEQVMAKGADGPWVLYADHVTAITQATATAEAELAKWRQWAHFVYLGTTNPVEVNNDLELRAAVCAAHDAMMAPLVEAATKRAEAQLSEARRQVWEEAAQEVPGTGDGVVCGAVSLRPDLEVLRLVLTWRTRCSRATTTNC